MLTNTVLKKNSSGESVTLLQEMLGLNLTGTFDDITDAAVKKFQTSQKITSDGIVGPTTWKYLLKSVQIRKLKRVSNATLASIVHLSSSASVAKTWNKYGNLLTVLSQILSVDAATLLAVLMIESSGVPFGPDGRPIIRFENHIFWKYWGSKNASTFNKHYRYNKNADGTARSDNKSWLGHWFSLDGTTWTEMHKGTVSSVQKLEWEALTLARSFNEDAAISSASFGLGQIIGFNARQCGYPSMTEFLDDMMSEKLQIAAMIEFIKNGSTMLDSLRNKDFVGFAKVYNGPGQPEFYGSKIKKCYEDAKTLGI